MDLETELAEGNSSHQSLEASLSELTARCEQLAVEQNSSDQGKADVEQTLTQYQGLIEELQEQIAAAQQHRQELEQTVATGAQANEAYQAELNELQTHYEKLSTEHQAETERRHDRDQQLADQQQSVELFQVDLQSVRTELDRSTGQVSVLETERETLNQQLVGLREKLAAREERVEANAGEDVGVSQELLVQFEEEKALLQQQVQQQEQQAQQLALELEQAHQCLQTAEKALLERVEEPVAVSEETMEEPAVCPTEPSEESTDRVAETTQETQFGAEDSQELTAVEAVETALVESALVESTTTAFDKQEPELEEAKEEFQPASFIDQYQDMMDDSDAENVEPSLAEPEAAPVANKLGAELDAMTASGGEESEEESDEALQAYMSNMLRRMRGDESDESSQVPQVDSSVKLNQNPNPVAAVDEVLGQVAPEVAEEPENLEPICMEELKRSSHKPTLPTDLAAMRELANSSARRAISKHHKRLHREKALGLFIACLALIGLGGYWLLTAVTAQDFLGLNFVGGAASVLLGGVGVFKVLGHLLLAIRDGSPAKKSVKTSVEETV